jgi:hypothetical protein
MQKPSSGPELRHRRQRFWQIIFPVIFVSLALTAGLIYVVLPASPTGGNVASLSHTATVLLTLPMLFLLLPMLAILAALIILLVRLAGWVPQAGESAFKYVEKARHIVQKSISKTVAPIFFIKQRRAEIQQLARSLRLQSKGGKQ